MNDEFSNFKKIFFPLFWKKRNYYLICGFDRKSAETVVFEPSAHDALLQTKTLGTNDFIRRMRKYLLDNKLANIELDGLCRMMKNI